VCKDKKKCCKTVELSVTSVLSKEMNRRRNDISTAQVGLCKNTLNCEPEEWSLMTIDIFSYLNLMI